MKKKSTAEAEQSAWWQQQTVHVNSSLELQLGPLNLTVGRASQAWLVAIDREQHDSDSLSRCQLRDGLPDRFDERYIESEAGAQLRFEPALASRPIVVRPYQPVFLPGHGEITFYLSTPVSVRIVAGTSAVPLREVTSQPLSKTWFGPNTRSGELYLSDRSHALDQVETLPSRPHRAITPLSIRNATEMPLKLDRISLPVPLLSLYGAADGSLWTQQLSLVREQADDNARVTIKGLLPRAGESLTLLSGPRQEPGRSNPVLRVFNALFGEGGNP